MHVNEIVPAGQTINIFKPGTILYPAVFRIRPPINYVLDANDINEQVHYLLLKKADFEMLKAEGRISGRSPDVLYEFSDQLRANTGWCDWISRTFGLWREWAAVTFALGAIEGAGPAHHR